MTYEQKKDEVTRVGQEKSIEKEVLKESNELKLWTDSKNCDLRKGQIKMTHDYEKADVDAQIERKREYQKTVEQL